MTDNRASVPWSEVLEELLEEDPEFRRLHELRKLVERIAKQVIDAREKAGLSQTQLAEQAGVSLHALARLERGQQPPSLRTLERVVQSLGGSLKISLQMPQETGAQAIAP